MTNSFIFTYDGTFKGLLSAIFDIFRLKSKPKNILPDFQFKPNFFDHPIHVATNHEWSERVLKGIARKNSKSSIQCIYRCFLSELPGVEMLIYDFIVKSMKVSESIENDYGDPTILKLHQIDKKIGREVHRMHAFVRFQEMKDGLFAAWIEPDFNVLPLIGTHFKKRYPAQPWLIFDAKRNYAIHYDLKKINYTTLINLPGQKEIEATGFSEAESGFQTLWKTYFKATNILERKNLKLHIQHVPKRYWKYLTEKQ